MRERVCVGGGREGKGERERERGMGDSTYLLGKIGQLRYSF